MTNQSHIRNQRVELRRNRLFLGRKAGGGVVKECLFDLKIAYSYVIRRADSEYNLGFHSRRLVSEIFAFYHLLEHA